MTKLFRLVLLMLIPVYTGSCVYAGMAATPPGHDIITDTVHDISRLTRGTRREQERLERVILEVVQATGRYSAATLQRAAAYSSLDEAQTQSGGANSVLYALTHGVRLDADQSGVTGQLRSAEALHDVHTIYDTEADAPLRVMGLMATGIGSYLDDRIALRRRLDLGSGSLWAGTFGMWQTHDGDGIYRSFDYQNAGVMVGYDRMIGDLLVGGAFTYAKGDIDIPGSTLGMDTYGISAYADYWHESGFIVTGSLGYLYADSSQTTHLYTVPQNLKRDFSLHSFWVDGRVGYRFELGRMSIAPRIGVVFQRSVRSAYSSRLAGQTFTRHGELSATSLDLPIEVDGGTNLNFPMNRISG